MIANELDLVSLFVSESKPDCLATGAVLEVGRRAGERTEGDGRRVAGGRRCGGRCFPVQQETASPL